MTAKTSRWTGRIWKPEVGMGVTDVSAWPAGVCGLGVGSLARALLLRTAQPPHLSLWCLLLLWQPLLAPVVLLLLLLQLLLVLLLPLLQAASGGDGRKDGTAGLTPPLGVQPTDSIQRKRGQTYAVMSEP